LLSERSGHRWILTRATSVAIDPIPEAEREQFCSLNAYPFNVYRSACIADVNSVYTKQLYLFSPKCCQQDGDPSEVTVQ
jgi:hypothetical protein